MQIGRRKGFDKTSSNLTPGTPNHAAGRWKGEPLLVKASGDRGGSLLGALHQARPLKGQTPGDTGKPPRWRTIMSRTLLSRISRCDKSACGPPRIRVD